MLYKICKLLKKAKFLITNLYLFTLLSRMVSIKYLAAFTNNKKNNASRTLTINWQDI